jgi:hypothetical protein
MPWLYQRSEALQSIILSCKIFFTVPFINIYFEKQYRSAIYFSGVSNFSAILNPYACKKCFHLGVKKNEGVVLSQF